VLEKKIKEHSCVIVEGSTARAGPTRGEERAFGEQSFPILDALYHTFQLLFSYLHTNTNVIEHGAVVTQVWM
jgi:hypothetical protein